MRSFLRNLVSKGNSIIKKGGINKQVFSPSPLSSTKNYQQDPNHQREILRREAEIAASRSNS